MSKMDRPLPGQYPGESIEDYAARIEARVEAQVRSEGQIPGRFAQLKVSPTFRTEHPIFRTTNHDYGSMAVTEYERPPTYRTVTREFTERQHLGLNFHHCGFNL
jgi:hypothetical protein